jgi:hypothetical protein
MLGDRRDNPQLRLGLSSGEINIAYPQTVEGKVVLFVWLDSFPQVKWVTTSHDIGHLVLKLQGFHGMRYLPKRNTVMEIWLNSLAHHPPLFDLQRSLGHDPQEMIDS